jgi:hypothetical protein
MLEFAGEFVGGFLGIAARLNFRLGFVAEGRQLKLQHPPTRAKGELVVLGASANQNGVRSGIAESAVMILKLKIKVLLVNLMISCVEEAIQDQIQPILRSAIPCKHRGGQFAALSSYPFVLHDVLFLFKPNFHLQSRQGHGQCDFIVTWLPG